MFERRFRRAEFQARLARARKYARKQAPVPQHLGQWLLRKLGLDSRFTRLVLIGLLVLLAYFLMVSDLFLVDRVILKDTSIDPEQISEALKRIRAERFYLIPRNHLLLLNRQNFLQSLQTEIPQIRTATSFRRIPPDTIEVTLEQRQAEYIWQSGGNYYLLDQDGVAFQKITNYEPAAYSSQILIADELPEQVIVGQELPIKKILSFISEAQTEWPNQVTQTNFTSFSVPAIKSLDIFLKTDIGFEVYFDLERSVRAQLTNLNLLLSQEIKPETYSGLSYIDLRLPNIAYYCYKDAPCALKQEIEE